MTSERTPGGYTLTPEDISIIDTLSDSAMQKARPSADSNNEAQEALYELPEEVADSLEIHGFRSHVRIVRSGREMHRDNFAALVSLIREGKLKGGVGRLRSGQLYADAPFLIISQPYKPLVSRETGRIEGTCLVNGQYADMVGELRTAFPHIRFVTPADIEQKGQEVLE
jgi:hypothetical protein